MELKRLLGQLRNCYMTSSFFCYMIFQAICYTRGIKRNSVQILLNSVALFLHFSHISVFESSLMVTYWLQYLNNPMSDFLHFLTKRHLVIDFSVRKQHGHKPRVNAKLDQKKKKKERRRKIGLLYMFYLLEIFKYVILFYFLIT